MNEWRTVEGGEIRDLPGGRAEGKAPCGWAETFASPNKAKQELSLHTWMGLINPTRCEHTTPTRKTDNRNKIDRVRRAGHRKSA